MADLQFRLHHSGTGAVPVPRGAPSYLAAQPKPAAASELEFKPAGSSRLLIVLTVTIFALAAYVALFGMVRSAEIALMGLGAVCAWLAVRQADADATLKRHLADVEEQHRQAMEALADRMWEMQEGEARSRDLIDTLGDLVVHRDRSGRIVYANRIFADLVECSPEELRGRTLEDLKIDVGLTADTAFSDGECLTYNDVSIRTSTSVRWFSWIELSTRDDTTGAVSHRAIARDITVRKKAEAASGEARERAEYANRSKSRFLATVSHELRTPLNGIMGMATLLADTALSPEQRTYVSSVSTSSNALLVLIEDLLDFSRIEAERFELEREAMSPREMIENIVELLVARAYAKQIGLGCHISTNVPESMQADPGRLRQVLMNVVGNAVKFTDTGGVMIDVSAHNRKSHSVLRFVVEDTGPGLAPADKARIFEEFEQADGTSTRRHGGTGLGLAISRRIVTAMGGQVTVENRPEGGAAFTVEIPIEAEIHPSCQQSDELADRSILIVSPNQMECEAMRRTLESRGGHVAVHHSLEDVLHNCGAADQYDTVIIDAILEGPEKSVIGELRAKEKLPGRAVVMIAPNDRDRLPQLDGLGYSGFLARPVRGKTLLRVLNDESEAESDQRAIAPDIASDYPQPVGCRVFSVLAAEDNEINAMLVTAALKKAGHEVTVVGNGRDAVAAATADDQRFDAILMDLHMPVMDGLDAIALIRKHEEAEGIDAVPILALTADGQLDTRETVISRGATGFVTKPVDPHELVSSINGAVSAQLC